MELRRGRESYAAAEWRSAFESFAAADDAEPLGADDLDLFATSAYMLGHEDKYFAILERLHRARLEAGEPLRAARAALWIGMTLAQHSEMGQASGWLSRAERLVEREGRECAEQGYLLMPRMFEHEAKGDLDAAVAAAAEATEIAERFGDRDLFGLAIHAQGTLLISQGRLDEGLKLLDEAMVAVASGELAPIPSGIVYCGVILACQAAHELQRAQEWTAALSEWCERQPDMIAFTGRCMVHRAEILQLRGDWPRALGEATRAEARSLEGQNERSAAEACYRQGEIHRLRGAYDAAEDAFGSASRRGWEPQPGLARLRLAQGDQEAARAAIDRVLAEESDPARLIDMLPAAVEIGIATGDVSAARAACTRLAEVVAGSEIESVLAILRQAEAATALAEGDPRIAITAAREAWHGWQGLGVRYESARVRELIGLACRALGDEDSARLELEAARGAFEELGAVPDAERLYGTLADQHGAHGLTARELEVLRLLAAGETNRSIAKRLVISERTVDRHVSNIFAKLGVSSRTAATAHAYQHDLL